MSLDAPLLEENLYVDCRYKIIHEDARLLVVDKPAPLPVHPVGRFKNKNLVSLLEKDRARSFHLINRLDSETTGIVLLAKDKKTAGSLGREFENRRVEKSYLGIVFGKPEEKEGVISHSLGWVEHPLGFRLRRLEEGGEEAVTSYELLKTNETYSFIRFIPKTGRTHQIRIHAASLGCPLVGDKIYIHSDYFVRYRDQGWQPDMLAALQMPRLALHAARLKIMAAGIPEVFEADLPEDMTRFLRLNLPEPSDVLKGEGENK